MRVIVCYFAVDLGTIHGTPLVPIQLDVSPSIDVGILKYMACYASGLIEDMMALMTPLEPTLEEAGFFKSRWSSSSLDKLEVGDAQSLVSMFGRRRLSEDLKVGELETRSLGMSIDINWLKRCPVCGQQNSLSSAKRVVGLDNIPDLDANYVCSNSRCNERKVRKKFDIRIARWPSEYGTVCVLPLITCVWNGASGSIVYGSKTDPPRPCKMPGAEIPKLSRSEYCRCRAINPTDVYYCWNCGKKNKNVQPKPPISLPYDLDDLREQVRLRGRKAQSETVARSVAFVEELMRRKVIVEITLCTHCGAQNEVDAIRCKRCGRRISADRIIRRPERRKKPWWKFW